MLYRIDHVWSSKECVCCACDPCERLDAHSICFVCVFCMLCILPFWYVMLVCDQYDVCEDSVGSVYIGGYGGLSESELCLPEIVSSQLSCSCPSVLL